MGSISVCQKFSRSYFLKLMQFVQIMQHLHGALHDPDLIIFWISFFSFEKFTMLKKKQMLMRPGFLLALFNVHLG